MYEIYKDEEEEIVEKGNILFANLNVQGIDYPLYFFNKKNLEGHYDDSGKSIIKTLMKTPINGARLSLIKCIKEQILLHQWEHQLWHQEMG